MKASKVREMSVNELQSKLKELRLELLKTRFMASTNQLKNLLKKGSLKKDIARTLTIIKEKENAKKAGKKKK